MSKLEEAMGKKNRALFRAVCDFFKDNDETVEIDEVVVLAVDQSGEVNILSNLKDVIDMLCVVAESHDMLLEVRQQNLLSKNSIKDEDFAKDGEFNSNGDPSIGVAGSEGIAPGSGGRSRLN